MRIVSADLTMLLLLYFVYTIFEIVCIDHGNKHLNLNLNLNTHMAECRVSARPNLGVVGSPPAAPGVLTLDCGRLLSPLSKGMGCVA